MNGHTPEHAAGLELARQLVAVERQRDELLVALKFAVDTIRIWHGFGHTTDEAEVWALYQQSPEMRAITAAIEKAEGRS